jgi:Na+/proline symporter
MLAVVDIVIVVVYLLTVIIIGIVAARKSEDTMNSYFLGKMIDSKRIGKD